MVLSVSFVYNHSLTMEQRIKDFRAQKFPRTDFFKNFDCR